MQRLPVPYQHILGPPKLNEDIRYNWEKNLPYCEALTFKRSYNFVPCNAYGNL